MTVEVVEKRKGMNSCAECKHILKADETVCPEHPDARIKKSIIIVRKETPEDDEHELPDLKEEDFEPADEEDGDDEDEDEEDEEDGEESEDEDEEDSDETEEEEDDETDDGDDKEVTVDPAVKKSLGFDTLSLATTLAEGIVKVFNTKTKKSEIEKGYEDIMTDFNNVMDAAVIQWLEGNSVSKSENAESKGAVLLGRVQNIIKEGSVMPKRPQALDSLQLPDDVKSYIAELETATPVEKSDDIYKGLTPEAAAIVRKSAEVLEAQEVKHWEDVAKAFSHVPGDKVELAKSLRTLHETNKDAYATVIKSLEDSEAALSGSDIFKSLGRPGPGLDEADAVVAKRRQTAEELVAAGKFPTLEQAEVFLMDGTAYKATN